MPESPLLSIIIVAYKSRAEIQACLASLPIGHRARPFEIVVVDNSQGEDAVESIVRTEFPHVTYLQPGENLGFGRANNLGYAHTTGEFTLFLNPDTVCNAAALVHCLEELQKNPKIGLITPRLVLADGSIDPACRRSVPTLWDGFCRASGLATRFPHRPLFSRYNLTHLSDDGVHRVGAINGAFMMTPTRVLKQIAPDGEVFDSRFFMYGDDLDLCIRIGRAGWWIVYDGRVQIVHLKGVSVARDFERMSRAIFDANRDVYLKHFNPTNSALVRWKYTAAFGAWKHLARVRAQLRGHRKVRPL